MEMTSQSSNALFRCSKCGFTVDADATDSEPMVLSPTGLLDTLSISNDPPSATELNVLTGEYKTISRAFLSLDSDIALLQARIEASKYERQRLSSSLEAYEFVLNPCRRFPDEILELIFALCVNEDADINRHRKRSVGGGDYPSTLDTKKSPWVLGHVCRRWRNIVLSLPDLWTVIDINWSGPPREILDPFIERRLSLALQRSRDRPLHISWNEQSFRDRTVLSMLCSRSFQWKTATIHTGIKGFGFLTPYSGAFPILSTLHLDFSREDWLGLDENNPIFCVFQDAPALRHITLSGDCTIIRHFSTQIPWNQITRFAVENVFHGSWHDFQFILPHLTNVEELILDLFDFNHSVHPRLRLVKLHTLHLSSVESFSMVGLLDSLTLPSLENLYIDPAQGVVPSVQRLLDRSACRLIDFKISDAGDDLVDLLRTGSLQTLYSIAITGDFTYNQEGYLISYTVSDAVLGALQRENESNRLPHLTKLTLIGETKGWSDRALVELFTSRRDIDQFPPGTVSLLRRVLCINTSRSDSLVIRDADAASQLRQLIEGGLVINDGDASVLLG